jgi:hypothetical protein
MEWWWSVGHLLSYYFVMPNLNGKTLWRIRTASSYDRKVYYWRDKHTAYAHYWYLVKSTYVLPPITHTERELLYSVNVDYRTLRYSRPDMTSFAANVIRNKFLGDMRETVKKTRGCIPSPQVEHHLLFPTTVLGPRFSKWQPPFFRRKFHWLGNTLCSFQPLTTKLWSRTSATIICGYNTP